MKKRKEGRTGDRKEKGRGNGLIFSYSISYLICLGRVALQKKL